MTDPRMKADLTAAFLKDSVGDLVSCLTSASRTGSHPSWRAKGVYEKTNQENTHKVWPSRLLSIGHLHVVDSEVEELVHRFEGARERHVVFQLDGHDLARQRLECAEDELF